MSIIIYLSEPDSNNEFILTIQIITKYIIIYHLSIQIIKMYLLNQKKQNNCRIQLLKNKKRWRTKKIGRKKKSLKAEKSVSNSKQSSRRR